MEQSDQRLQLLTATLPFMNTSPPQTRMKCWASKIRKSTLLLCQPVTVVWQCFLYFLKYMFLTTCLKCMSGPHDLVLLLTVLNILRNALAWTSVFMWVKYISVILESLQALRSTFVKVIYIVLEMVSAGLWKYCSSNSMLLAKLLQHILLLFFSPLKGHPFFLRSPVSRI